MDLSLTFLGNSLLDYGIFMGIVIASVVIGKFIELVFESIVSRVAKRTKSAIDDVVIEEVGKVIFHVFIVIGVYIGSLTLTFSETISRYFATFIKIVIVFILVRFLLSLWGGLLDKVIHPMVKKSENEMDDVILPVINKTIRVLIVIMAVLMVMSELGFNVLSFVAGLGIGGLALAMASKDFVANIFGAFSIYSDKMYSIGDKIKVKGEEGEVIEIGLRSTKLTKPDGTIVILPNSLMTSNPVLNISEKKKKR